MDIVSLRLFVSAAEALNITAAGRKLGLAPAVASARLARLERELGTQLLHRTTRKVALSLEGAEFLPYAREILAQAAAGRAALGVGEGVATGTLRFAAPSTFAHMYIAPLMPEFLRQHPQLRLDLRWSDTQQDLLEGSFDLALRNFAPPDSSLKGRKLAPDTRILCASPDYLAQRGEPTEPGQLADHDLIAFKSLKPRRLRRDDGEMADFDPTAGRCRLMFDDGLSQKVATIAGGGVSANSLWSVHRELRSGALVRVLPDYVIDDQSAIWLIYPQSNVLTLKVRVLMDFLLEQIGRHPPWGEAAA